MKIMRHLLRPALGLTLSSFLLSGCVTNHEGGNPEGWQEITPAAVKEIQAMVPQNIAAKGYLSMGSNPPFAPFEFKDSEGNIIGLEVDLGRALAATMGLDLRVVDQDFSKILPAVSAGTVDFGGSGFTDTEERRANYDFVNSLYAGVQWAQQTGDHVDPNNPCGLSIAVQRTTVSETDDVRPKSEKCVAEGKEPIEVLAYDTSDNAATALILGRADAFSADSPVTAWAIKRAEGKIETTGDMFQAAPYGFAVPKDSPLGPALAAAMQHLIDSGDYERIMKQWNVSEGYLDHALINEKPIS